MPEPVPEAILDIQHDTDPAHDHGPSRRIPHLGHAALFGSLSTMCTLSCVLAVGGLLHIHTQADAYRHVGAGLAAQAVGYVISLGISAWLFSMLWEKPFLIGIDWNALAVRRFWYRLVSLGVLTALVAALAESWLPQPKNAPIEQAFNTTAHCWEMTAFGILLVPVFEEIAFRGFLLPALATAYDWLALDRTPAGLRRWESSSLHTGAAWVFGSVFSSIAFAAIHADQIAHAWGPLAVLFCVGLIFCYVRVKMHSVASTVLLHAVYNATQFASAMYVTGFYRHLDKLH